jgi:SsrA-binding protein
MDVIAVNKKARRDYFIEETFEAGIMLKGSEIKSVRNKKVNIEDAYILIKDKYS